MEVQNVVVVSKSAPKRGFKAVLAAAVVVVSSNAAMAADGITSLSEGATENMTAGLAVVGAIFAVGVGINGLLKGYDYLKSGIRKA